MDFLQIALILLIVLMAIFLSITGFQVFLILKDLKKALHRLNAIIYSEDKQSLRSTDLKKVEEKIKASIKPEVKKNLRFFKKSL